MALMPHWPLYTGAFKSISNINVFAVLQKLGNPQNKLKGVFHIGGTNGKGSTVTYIYTILKQAGYAVNKYISPHLIECNERINLNGADISDEALFYYIEKVRLACQSLSLELTMFEATTVAAVLAFADSVADFNIIEVGMGGLSDATNIFEPHHLKACIITPISYDHQDFLGKTLYEIALQKTAILKKNVPAIISTQPKEALQGILDLSSRMGINPQIFWRDFAVELIEDTANNAKMLINGDFFSLPGLKGNHQIINATTAIQAVKDSLPHIPNETISIGIQKANIKGRLEEVLNKEMLNILPNGSRIFFDGAHNPGGAFALSEFIKDFRRQNPEFESCYVILGRTKGTDSQKFAIHFQDCIECLITTTVKGEIKPESSTVIACQVKNIIKNISISKNLLHAFELIKHSLNERKVLIFITGSLYLSRDIKLFNSHEN
jgi:dihydrofolate synthase/folylpolyglutamate synthase